MAQDRTPTRRRGGVQVPKVTVVGTATQEWTPERGGGGLEPQPVSPLGPKFSIFGRKKNRFYGFFFLGVTPKASKNFPKT